MKTIAISLVLLAGCAPGLVYSRAALPDETPFDAEVKAAGAASITVKDVGAILVSNRKSPEALQVIQCLACHRTAEHPPVRSAAPRYEWKETTK